MKKHAVHITENAIGDLISIHAYYADDFSLAAANTLIDALEVACSKLERLPLRGHVPPELERLNVLEYRQILYEHYRIIYEIAGTKVFVHAVVDGRRDLDDLLRLRMLR